MTLATTGLLTLAIDTCSRIMGPDTVSAQHPAMFRYPLQEMLVTAIITMVQLCPAISVVPCQADEVGEASMSCPGC